MEERYLPEGELQNTERNRLTLSSCAGLEAAMRNRETVEGIATLCDGKMRLKVDLGVAEGIIEPEEAVYCRAGETRKDIAIITRVGKPVCGKILSVEREEDRVVVRLSRRAAQEECIENYLSRLLPGDVIPARVTHLEPFGAFLDVGCGVASLLSVDCISVSRISHPKDRLACGDALSVAVRSIDRENGHIYVSLRELLGTWMENASAFEVGQTVTGIIRSVESYGVFIELAPNLAGLAEVRESDAEELRGRIGKSVAVYVKSILPERMKIKLVLIDGRCEAAPRRPLRYFLSTATTKHIDRWIYSPAVSSKIVETDFDAFTG